MKGDLSKKQVNNKRIANSSQILPVVNVVLVKTSTDETVRLSTTIFHLRLNVMDNRKTSSARRVVDN